MYIDFYKYNYAIIPEKNRERYIARDKVVYKQALQNWFNDNLDTIVERKWQLDELFFIQEYSGFAGILRESENLYELGLFTSCIALACIIAEDFARFLATKSGNPKWAGLTQFERLKKLLFANVIIQESYDKLDDIRKIRNDVLHYDDNFKLKSQEELKESAFNVLTDLRNILKNHLGFKKGQISADDFIKIQEDLINGMAKKPEYKSFMEMQFRLRNAVSQLLDLDLAFDPKVKELIRDGIFKVLSNEFDDDVDLLDLVAGLPVCVDFDKKSKKKFQELKIKHGDQLYAVIHSIIDANGQSAIWHFVKIRRI